MREAATLVASGRMWVAAVVPYAQFPFSDDVETVAPFVRS